MIFCGIQAYAFLYKDGIISKLSVIMNCRNLLDLGLEKLLFNRLIYKEADIFSYNSLSPVHLP